MKKTVVITLFLALLVGTFVFVSPRLIQKQEVAAAAKIKTDNEIFISRALDEFAKKNPQKPSEIAQLVADELNLTAVNPYNKKEKAYTFEANCKGCNNIEYDDNVKMIILTTYNKKGNLVARTVIKPPSYVTYYKDNKN